MQVHLIDVLLADGHLGDVPDHDIAALEDVLMVHQAERRVLEAVEYVDVGALVQE